MLLSTYPAIEVQKEEKSCFHRGKDKGKWQSNMSTSAKAERAIAGNMEGRWGCDPDQVPHQTGIEHPQGASLRSACATQPVLPKNQPMMPQDSR